MPTIELRDLLTKETFSRGSSGLGDGFAQFKVTTDGQTKPKLPDGNVRQVQTSIPRFGFGANMRMSKQHRSRVPSRTQQYNVVLRHDNRFGRPGSRRLRGGQRNEQLPFVPPEDWYEPNTESSSQRYRIVAQPAGDGYRHVVTPAEIRARLNQLPLWMVSSLEVIQLSQMTRKKRSFPCYGMQWGTSLYLYPLEETRHEYFGGPPKPAQYNEAKMFGGRWRKDSSGGWTLIWTEPAIKNFYLNNILIHELGHLLDSRNTSYSDRERFAEWFAIEFGYKPTRQRGFGRNIRRRHHAK